MSITDNISSVTISRATAEQLQHKQPIARKSTLKRSSDKPNDSEVQSMAVDITVWTTAKDRAERIAADIVRCDIDDPNAELGAEAQAKVRSIASKLLVIENDTTVTIYNNITQAAKARAINKERAVANKQKSVTE
jgi:hypothetical protein